MYSVSTQRKAWTFKNEEELSTLRYHANQAFIKNRTLHRNGKESLNFVLTPEEELLIVRHYEEVLRDFLHKFMPRNECLPREVRCTVHQIYKRFYTANSVMDYHPKEMMITCIYLACKLCEYMLPIDLFVQNIEGDKKLLKYIIIDQELELLARINFQIHVINPSRAIEGILLDLRTRCKFRDVKRLQAHISSFLSAMWRTDVCLLYSPSQIALAAVMHACSRCKENIDDFIMNTFLNCPQEPTRSLIIKVVRDIRTKVMSQNVVPPIELISPLEERLSQCRNPHNDPTSNAFKRRMQEYLLETYMSSSSAGPAE